MNSVAMTSINVRKDYLRSRGSNHQPPALKSYRLPTKLYRLGVVYFLHINLLPHMPILSSPNSAANKNMM